MCPTGLLYDTTIKMCNYPNKVICTDTSTLPPVTAAPMMSTLPRNKI